MNNFSYLFWAYAIFWILLFTYVYNLLRKSNELRSQIEALRGYFGKNKEEKLSLRK
jgi:CcmD family protein